MSRALQRSIFAGCRALGLDDQARRDLQLAETGKASMRDMDETDLQKILKRLKRDGFEAGLKAPRKGKLASRGDLRFVHVLWRLLGEAGVLRDPSRAGLNAFVRASFGKSWGSVPADIDMLRDAQKIDAVIQALKQWAAREGVVLNTGRRR